jgi:hypothetical protein
MPWPKPSAEHTQLLARVLTGHAGEPRLVFGAPTWFVNGNMFAGVFGDGVFLRLPEPDLGKIFSLRGVEHFEPMKGGVMKEYAYLLPRFLGNERLLAVWLNRSLSYTRSLPAKEKKTKK